METPRFEVYPQLKDAGVLHEVGQDSARGERIEAPSGEYGWRFRAANGQISAVSGEGFTRREDAKRAVIHFLVAVGADHEDTFVTPPILDVDH